MKNLVRRALNVLGALLVLGGVALLVFVVVSYYQARFVTAQPVHVWSAAQQQRGKSLARELARTQRIAVPKRIATPPRHAGTQTRTIAAVAPGSEPPTRIVIPRISLDVRVVQSPPINGEWIVSDWAVGHLNTTPNPGAPGNMALAGHDDIKGEVFKRLNELAPGDPIRIYTRHAVYTYIVTGQQVVDPSDTDVLAPTAAPTATLITCTPYWVDTQRLVVHATLRARAAA